MEKKLSKKVSFSLSKEQSILELKKTIEENEDELRMVRVLIDEMEEHMLKVQESMDNLKVYIYRFHDIQVKSTKSSHYSTPLTSPRFDYED
jgi:hypothetical protein